VTLSLKNDLTIITTHLNADFDAVASMLAAQKLYPEALVVFPGSQEKNLRNFFISSMVYLFNMEDMKHIDFSRIKKLVLVDTRQSARIGKFSALIDRPDVEIHVYDHHPVMPTDIKAHYEVNRLTGATVTILTEILKEKNIDISPDEATILCLGIYEDTGSFTFPSTTEQDFSAAAFLLSKGANLNIISSMIAREISPEQISLLNDMIQSAMHYMINGIDIVLTNIISDNYIPDFAVLVHKFIKMENLNAVFAIAGMENKIHVVARSRIPEVDVGVIVTLLGGGGHSYAASATLKEQTLAQVEHRLLEILYSKVRARRKAKDIMSAPPITVGADVSCKEAANLLTRYNINALVVTELPDRKDELLGFISRQVIEKALFHHLDDVPVRDYMTTDMAWVGPDADMPEIQRKIIENKQRVLPVVNQDVITGVITRTDLLNILARQTENNAENQFDPGKDITHARTRNIINFMNERLTARVMDLLKTIGKVASQLGAGAYVVGGFVRDLFLYRQNDDMDIVIEGDGIAFAREYAARNDARVHTHDSFGTAVITFSDGFKIDVASARMEYYKFPTAMPIVEMSSIKLDLFRRDFTINTLSIQLNPERFGILIDFFSAQKDLKEKSIRVLHNLSFVEDPTRAFRAIKFEQRFGFTIGKLTSGLIDNAVKMDLFSRLIGRRIFNEIKQILEEENPVPAIMRLDDFQLLKVIHPSLQLSADMTALLNAVKKVISWHDLLFLEESYMKWPVYFLAIIRGTDDKVTEDICTRLELAPRHRVLLGKDRFAAERSLFWLERNATVPNHVLCEKLSEFKTEMILFMMAATRQEQVKRVISNYCVTLRYVQPAITGKDLLEMGVEPGPVYKEILKSLRDKKVDGMLKTKDDEVAHVKYRLKAEA
jgi:tRNA nucleotidyltransferase (CCA-adding enzyme)